MSLVPDHINLTDGTTHGFIGIVPNNLQIYNADETGNILMSVGVEIPENNILISAPNVILRADNLTTRNTLDTINYELRPNAQPSDNQIMQWQSTGQVSWIPTPGGGGSTDAFINSQPLTVPQVGSVLIADGTDPFNSHPSNDVQIISTPSSTSILLTNSNVPTGHPSLSYSDDALILENLVNNISRDNYISIAQNIVLDTTQSDIPGNINLNTSGGVLMTMPGGNSLGITDRVKRMDMGCGKGRGFIAMADDTADLYISTSTLDTTNEMLLRSPNINLRTNTLTIEGEGTLSSYQLPVVQPTANTIMQFQADGSSAFVPIPIANPDAFINTQPNTIPSVGSILIADGDNATNSHPSSVVKVNATGLTIGDTSQITNEGSYMYTRFSGGNIVYNSQNGGMVFQFKDPLIFQNNQTYAYTSLLQNVNGNFSLINENAGGIFEFKVPDGSVAFTTGSGLGCTFNGIGSINSSGSDLIVSNGYGNLELSSKFNKVIIDTGDILQVNQGSEFQGDMTINKVDPKLNFNNTDYSTQLCNVEFKSATQELVMEHHSPDLASKCNIRLGTNDINIQSTFSALNAGNINLETGTGYTFINQYKLPNINPTVDGQLLSANIDGTSSWITPTIPAITYTYWVSNQGNDAFNGTIITPFQTIARAIVEANKKAQTDKVVINVMVGTYNEGALSITKNNITINGGTAIPSQTVVEAVITYTIDNAPTALIASGLYGLTVRGVVYAGSSIEDGSYVLGACIIGTLQDAIVPIVNSYSLAGLRDITVSNCVVYAWNRQCLTTSTGRINCTATLFTQSGLLLDNAYPLIECTGNSLISLFGCQCFSLNNTNQAPPIIRLANTIAPSSTYTFNSCTIQYIFNTANVAPLNKVCIGCTNTVGISMYVYNNLFIGEGTRITNSGTQYVIISKQGSGSVVITYGQNLCGATANHYATAAVRTQLVTATN